MRRKKRRQPKLFLTPKQLMAERVHLGSSFNKDHYVYISDKNNLLNEGTLGMVLSLPAILKAARFIIDKGYEEWTLWFDEKAYSKIDKRTWQSLFDENSVEDLPTDHNADEWLNKESTKTPWQFFLNGIVSGGVHDLLKGSANLLDKGSKETSKLAGVKIPHPHRSKEQEEKRKERVEKLQPEFISNISEGVSAIGHALHHFYGAVFDLAARTLLQFISLQTGMSIDENSTTKKFIDFLGNLIFVAVVAYLLSHGAGISGMSAVKVWEITAETMEIVEIVSAVAVLSPAIKETLTKLKSFCGEVRSEGLVDAVVGLAETSIDKFSKSFKKFADAQSIELMSSKFDPQAARGIKKKKKKADRSDTSQYDYYGNPIKAEAILIKYIGSMLNELKNL